MRSCIAWALILCGAAVLLPPTADAATIASSFDDYRYSYSIIPDADEQIRSFHLYSGLKECGIDYYWDFSLPAGWYVNPETYDGHCVLTFYTDGAPLPAGEEAVISYTHYCDPCCHSWFLSDEGGKNPLGNVIDDDEQHTEPCSIPAPWDSQCGGPGLLLAPRFPEAVDDAAQNWGTLKASYR